MDYPSEPSILFEKRTMFTKSKFCKIYRVSDDNPSGYVLHSHDYMQIWYIVKGSCEHWVEGQKHLMICGDMFILPPKVEHKVVRMEDAEIICCEFSLDHFFPPTKDKAYWQVHEAALNLSFAWLFLKDANDIRSKFTLRPATRKRVNTLMNAMLAEYENGEIYFDEFLRVQIMELLLELAREYSQSPQRHAVTTVYEKYKPMVENAIQYVNEHYTESLKLEDICHISMVSKTYFCYLFKLITQQTLVEYITTLRINKAIELLNDPNNSVTWISFEAGFNDSTHFTRTFKKIVGVSPRTYRTLNHVDSTKGD